MPRHVVGRAADVPPGGRLLVEAGGRKVLIFNLSGEFFGLLNRCPHQGGDLSLGVTCGLLTSEAPGEYRRTRDGEIIRCPWHAWEFDIRTGLSVCEPGRIRTMPYPVTVTAAEPGLLAAETVPVAVEDALLVVET